MLTLGAVVYPLPGFVSENAVTTPLVTNAVANAVVPIPVVTPLPILRYPSLFPPTT